MKHDGWRTAPVLVMVLVMFLGTSSPVSATEWAWADLRDRVRTANRDVVAEGTLVGQAHQRVLAEGADLMPLKLGYTLMDLQPGSAGFLGRASHKVTVSQELPLTGRLEAQAAVAQNDADARAASLEAMVRDRTLALDRALVAYQLQTLVLENLKTEGELVRQLLQAAQVQYSTGKLPYSSLVSVQLRLADLEGDQRAQEQARVEGLLDVQELAGLDDPGFAVNLPPLAAPAGGWAPVDLGTLVSLAWATNPQKRALVKGRDSAAASVAWERAKALPDVGLMAETTYQGMDGALILGLGFDLGLPVLGARGVEARVAAARDEVKVHEGRMAALELFLKKRLERLVLSRDSLVGQIALLEEAALGPGQENLTHMFQEYRVQSTDLPAVVDAVVTSFDLKNRYYGLVAEVYQEYFELEALSGSENLLPRIGL